MLFDPMVMWPKVPTLSAKVQYFVENGIIIYGGTKGPFKLSGSLAVSDTVLILNELKHNDLTYNNFINHISKSTHSKNMLYVLTKLHANGCLSDKEFTASNQSYFDRLNQDSKNYSSLNELLSFKRKLKIKISASEEIKTYLTILLEKDNFSITEGNDYDWKLFQPGSYDELINQVNEDKKTFIFTKVNNGTVLGPIISKNAIRLNEVSFFYDNISKEKIEKHELHNVFLTFMKTALRLTDNGLDKGAFLYKKFSLNYINKLELNQKDLSPITKFEKSIRFSAPEYIMKGNHLSHYRESNIKLARTQNFTSPFWKVIPNPKIPQKLQNIFEILIGFKDKKGNKKFSPTGGNLNSNMILYLNLDVNSFNGIGVYTIDNINNIVYQIDDNITKIKESFQTTNTTNSLGYIVLGNNVDLISEKYSDFGFKIANLNIGVQLASLLSITNINNGYQISYINQFDENKISDAAGSQLSNFIFNIVLEVSK